MVGVLPQNLVEREVGHRGLTRLELVGTMHERKARMAGLADAFVALPGGTGTLDELIEIMTWSQLGLHAKPVALYDVDDFWAPFLALLDHMVASGYAPASARSGLRVVSSPQDLLRSLHGRSSLADHRDEGRRPVAGQHHLVTLDHRRRTLDRGEAPHARHRRPPAAASSVWWPRASGAPARSARGAHAGR